MTFQGVRSRCAFTFLLACCQCQNKDVLFDVTIAPPMGCIGDRIEKYILVYDLANVQGAIINDTKQDVVYTGNAQLAVCEQAIENPRSITCHRRLRPAGEMRGTELVVKIHVEAWDQDTHAVALQGDGQANVANDGQTYQATVPLTPLASPQGNLLRIRSLPSGTSQTLRSVWADVSGSAWAVGDAGTMVRWQGLQRQSWPALLPPDLRAIWGASMSDAWAVGTQGTLQRLLSESWTTQTALGGQALNAIGGNRADNVWVVGDAAAIFHFDGQRWAADKSLLNAGSLGAGEDIKAISVDAASNALAVGMPRGLALVYSAATGAWSRPAFNLGVELHDVWLHGSADGWAVGSGSSTPSGAYRWTGSWSANVCSTSSKPLRGVWGNSAERVWAAGDDGALYQLNTSGCEKISTDSLGPLYDVWGSDQDLWAVGANGAVIYACISQ